MTQGNGYIADEKSNISELRRRLKDLMTPEMYADDNVFERFLRARNQNLDAAELMLKNHLRWRKTLRVDFIKEEFKPIEFLKTFDSMSMMCYDKEGAPVIYVAFGNMDIKGGYKCVNLNDCLKFFVQHLEEYIDIMKAKSKELNKPINQWVMVFDYTNLTFSNATFKPAIQYLLKMAGMYEANYPERLKAAYLINGSMIFQICFAMFKPFLHGNTFKKINFFGSTDYPEALLKIIDEDHLPAFLGGKKTDPDGNPKCLETIKFGGIVPERYYLTGRNRKLSVIPDSRLLVVTRLSRANVEVEVVHPGSTLEWRYTVKNKNIDFSVFCKTADELTEVIPKQRIETLVSSENGMCICDIAGKYILEFDNSYSWMYSKHIYYTVNVIDPLN